MRPGYGDETVILIGWSIDKGGTYPVSQEYFPAENLWRNDYSLDDGVSGWKGLKLLPTARFNEEETEIEAALLFQFYGDSSVNPIFHAYEVSGYPGEPGGYWSGASKWNPLVPWSQYKGDWAMDFFIAVLPGAIRGNYLFFGFYVTGNAEVKAACTLIKVNDAFVQIPKATPLRVAQPISAASILLTNNDVLIIGGGSGWRGEEYPAVSTVQRYSFARDEWYLTSPMAKPRAVFTVARLFDGRVLVMGGTDLRGSSFAECEIFDPITNFWSPAASMIQARVQGMAHILADGKVIVFGGSVLIPQTPVHSSEIYDAKVNSWAGTSDMPVSVVQSVFPIAESVVQLDSGNLLVSFDTFAEKHLSSS